MLTFRLRVTDADGPTDDEVAITVRLAATGAPTSVEPTTAPAYVAQDAGPTTVTVKARVDGQARNVPTAVRVYG